MFLDLTMPYKVADMSLAEWGRTEIEIAEHEMPGTFGGKIRQGGHHLGFVACDLFCIKEHGFSGRRKFQERFPLKQFDPIFFFQTFD